MGGKEPLPFASLKSSVFWPLPRSALKPEHAPGLRSLTQLPSYSAVPVRHWVSPSLPRASDLRVGSGFGVPRVFLVPFARRPRSEIPPSGGVSAEAFAPDVHRPSRPLFTVLLGGGPAPRGSDSRPRGHHLNPTTVLRGGSEKELEYPAPHLQAPERGHQPRTRNTEAAVHRPGPAKPGGGGGNTELASSTQTLPTHTRLGYRV